MNALYCWVALCLLWAGLVWLDEVDRAVKSLVGIKSATTPALEMRKDVYVHASFYGAAIWVWIGFSHDSRATFLVAALWFIMLIAYAARLSRQLQERTERERVLAHRKMAGTVRDIVKSEIVRNMKEVGTGDAKHAS